MPLRIILYKDQMYDQLSDKIILVLSYLIEYGNSSKVGFLSAWSQPVLASVQLQK